MRLVVFGIFMIVYTAVDARKYGDPDLLMWNVPLWKIEQIRLTLWTAVLFIHAGCFQMGSY